MLKPLTFAASLAIALGASGLALAGDHFGHSYPSSQGDIPSPQGVYASAQGDYGCDTGCAPAKKHRLCDMFKRREKCTTYEWVLKKKRCGGLMGMLGHKKSDCGGGGYDAGCSTCGGDVAYPSGQWPSAQGYDVPSAYGAGQMAPTSYGTGQYGTGQYGAGQMGAGQMGAGQMNYGGQMDSGGSMMPSGGDSVSPAPELPEAATPPGEAPQARNGGLLFLAPSGN